MDKELIERLAREAGFDTGEDAVPMHEDSPFDASICVNEYAVGERMARFASLIAEACAQVAEQNADNSRELRIATAIRVKFQPPGGAG